MKLPGRSPRSRKSAPLRVKLVAAMILPVLVVAGYLALRVDGAFDARQVASRQEQEVARFSAVSTLSQAIAAEQSNLVNTLTGNDEMVAGRAATDAALDEVRRAGTTSTELARIEALYTEMQAIRAAIGDDVNAFRIAAATEIASGATDEGSVVQGALRLAEIGKAVIAGYDFDADAIADVETAQGLGDIALIQEVRNNFSSENATALGLATLGAEGSTTADALEFFAEQQARTDGSLDNLTSLSTPELGATVTAYLAGEEYAQINEVRLALDAVQPGELIPFNSLELVAIGNGVDDSLGGVEATQVQRLLDNASDTSRSATWDLVRSGGIGAALFTLVVFILIALYRGIRNPLGRLTERSREIAEVELPEVVTAMRSGDVDRIPEITPLVAESNDEIGELVHAFNGMHRTAIELAAEQAGSRRVVADMFVNLGRRNQRLLNRMLKGLTALERNEQDPDTLSALYDIDHLATRMRRNAESLLILAGAAQARRWKNPVGAYDVIRAALAEVEGYERVQIEASADVMIRGDYVADLTHLLAELIENALSFSPPTSTVSVVTRSTHRGHVIAIIDQGLGMSAELITLANNRIMQAANEEETPSEFLGHYVVGRLAARHGIGVDLLDGVAGGLTARVVLPAAAIEATTEEPAPLDALDEATPAAEERPALRPSMDWDSFDEVNSINDRPLAAPTPHLPLPKVVVPPSPAHFDDVSALDAQTVDVADAPVAPADGEVDLADGGAPTTVESDVTVFGSKRRTPGSSMPTMTLGFATEPAPDDASSITNSAVAVDIGEPDAVRSSLSGFQSGTARADRED